ncbi:hypothetical protein IWW50_004441, partial [Coemansia erecta]
YLAHRLLAAPATHAEPQPLDTSSAAAEPQAVDTAPRAASYPFRVRANVVDRDVVFVPAGWDSAAKIGYLREPFDVASTQEAWASDEARYRGTVERATRGAAETDDNDSAGSVSLLLMFGAAVAAPKHRAGLDAEGGSAVAAATLAAAGLANEVVVEDDQAFFERLFEEQQEQMALEGDEAGASGLPDTHGARSGGSSNRLVSSLLRNVHTAESSLSTASDVPDAAALSDDNDEPEPSRHQRTDSIDTAASGSMGRVAGARAGWRPQQATTPPADAPLRRKLQPAATAPPEPAGSAPPSEELTSFFQNLLGRKGGHSSSAASSTGKGSPQPPSRPLAAAAGARSSAPKDIQADLERLKAQLKRPKD